jgi:hypothetical protein
MKFVFVLLMAVSFNLNAYAQEPAPETPAAPAATTPEDMTLVGKDSGKPLHVEKKSTTKKHAAKKGKKAKKSKKAHQH